MSAGGDLLAEHDALLLDLDGVVWTGGRAVPAAPESLDRARAVGVAIAFVTNNASRTPQEVAERLVGLGVAAVADEVHTSSEAAARVVAERVTSGAAVLAVGGPGVSHALRGEGLAPVTTGDDRLLPDGRGVAAVVQGFGPEVCWADLAAAAHAVRAGALWVATNTDPTLPTERGPAPGNGSLVGAVRAAAERDPLVAGKPEAPLVRLAAERCGGHRPLMVGDRLDTDVAGARAAGIASALVLTGVSGPDDLLAAPPHHRPDLVLADLGGLHAPTRRAVPDGDAWRCGGATARVEAGQVRAAGDAGDDGLDLLRATAAAVWQARDRGGSDPAGTGRDSGSGSVPASGDPGDSEEQP